MHLIIGYGQIGRSLSSVLQRKYQTIGIDKGANVAGEYESVHVCYPYSPKFVEITKAYLKKYKPDLVIIHSTVPIGTTRQLGQNAVHSPVIGVHPNLEAGMRTFIKFFGGVNRQKTEQASQIFKRLNIHVELRGKPEETEAAKLLCTTYYGWNIIFEKMVREYCKQNKLDFAFVYTQWNLNYNKGYTKLGMANVMRPVLEHMDGPIGGHCVIPNAEILIDNKNQFFPGQIITDYNKTIK